VTHDEFFTLLRVERARRNLKWPAFCEIIGVGYQTAARWLMADDSPHKRWPKKLVMEAVAARLKAE